MLSIEPPTAPEVLVESLRSQLADYRAWRRSIGRIRRPDGSFSVHEILPYWRIPRGARLGEGTQSMDLERAGWHLQVHENDRPRHYARAALIESRWVIEWIGEAWLARAIDRGLRRLEREEGDLPTAEVRLLSSRLYRFSSLWLAGQSRHLIVSTPASMRSLLPILTWLPADALADRLADYYGRNFGRGGVRAADPA